MPPLIGSPYPLPATCINDNKAVEIRRVRSTMGPNVFPPILSLPPLSLSPFSLLFRINGFRVEESRSPFPSPWLVQEELIRLFPFSTTCARNPPTYVTAFRYMNLPIVIPGSDCLGSVSLEIGRLVSLSFAVLADDGIAWIVKNRGVLKTGSIRFSYFALATFFTAIFQFNVI